MGYTGYSHPLQLFSCEIHGHVLYHFVNFYIMKKNIVDVIGTNETHGLIGIQVHMNRGT